MKTDRFAIVYFRTDSVTGKREADWYDETSARTLNLWDSPKLIDRRVKFAIGTVEVERLHEEYLVWIGNEDNYSHSLNFKDEVYFTKLDVENIDVHGEYQRMVKRGWVIKTKAVNDKTDIKVYANKTDYQFKDLFCQASDISFEKAFMKILKQIKEYYVRVA